LAERIRFFRAQPPDSAGVRGAVAKLAEGAAAAIGYQLGIAAVEDEEVRLTRLYLSRVLELDADSRKLMQKEIIPAQFETQRAVSELKQQAQATSWSQSP
jgi:hypothetical protein